MEITLTREDERDERVPIVVLATGGNHGAWRDDAGAISYPPGTAGPDATGMFG